MTLKDCAAVDDQGQKQHSTDEVSATAQKTQSKVPNKQNCVTSYPSRRCARRVKGGIRCLHFCLILRSNIFPGNVLHCLKNHSIWLCSSKPAHIIECREMWKMKSFERILLWYCKPLPLPHMHIPFYSLCTVYMHAHEHLKGVWPLTSPSRSQCDVQSPFCTQRSRSLFVIRWERHRQKFSAALPFRCDRDSRDYRQRNTACCPVCFVTCYYCAFDKWHATCLAYVPLEKSTMYHRRPDLLLFT